MSFTEQFGTIATALAVFVAAIEVRRNTNQARTDFEDGLNREYREILRCIPVEVHLGEEVTASERWPECLARIYQYLDLTNEQIFLRQMGRVSRATWRQWVEGIQATLDQPAFEKAWREVKAKAPGRFSELQRLEASGFREDPRRWMPVRRRLLPG